MRGRHTNARRSPPPRPRTAIDGRPTDQPAATRRKQIAHGDCKRTGPILNAPNAVPSEKTDQDLVNTPTCFKDRHEESWTMTRLAIATAWQERSTGTRRHCSYPCHPAARGGLRLSVAAPAFPTVR
jgi:hypothetical protein